MPGITTDDLEAGHRVVKRASGDDAQASNRQAIVDPAELPDATDLATPAAAGVVMVGRPNATAEPSLPPALRATEAWARGVIEPLTRTIAEQQQLLIRQAEALGRLSSAAEAAAAEADRAKAHESKLLAELDTALADLSASQARLAANVGAPGHRQDRWSDDRWLRVWRIVGSVVFVLVALALAGAAMWVVSVAGLD
jgi:hypothetical protein